MKTAARRTRLLNLLYRGATTVPAVSRELGVSERTIYRDLAYLREDGYRIRATSGPGGGVRIDPESRPSAVHFEVAEIVGLALSVAIVKATPHLPFAASAEAALNRARRALTPERRRAIRRLEQRILVGEPASPRTIASLGPIDPDLLAVFENCFTGSRAMAFAYVDGAGTPSTRKVECIAAILHTPCWYILAWDLEKDASRLFRMDRITSASMGEALSHVHTVDEAIEQEPPRKGAPDAWGREPLG